jgi:hypothetical protein
MQPLCAPATLNTTGLPRAPVLQPLRAPATLNTTGLPRAPVLQPLRAPATLDNTGFIPFKTWPTLCAGPHG